MQPLIIYLFGDIGCYSAADLAFQLSLAGPDIKEIEVRICTDGGSVFEGLAMYHCLKEHPAKVTTKCYGLAASMGSIVFLAGDERIMYPGSMLMIHDPAGIREPILSEMRDSLNQIYQEYSGMTAGKVSKMMSEETWIGASEAVKMGFATSASDIIPEEKAPIAKLRPEKFRAAPSALRDLVAKAGKAIEFSGVPGKELSMDLKQLCLVLGIPEGSSLEECLSAVEALKGSDISATETLDAVVARLNPKVQARIMALQGSELRASAKAIDTLIARHADVFSPALEAWARKMPIDAVQEFIALSGSKAKPEAKEPEGNAPQAPAGGNKANFRQIAKALGKTEAQVRATYEARGTLKFPPMTPSEAFING
jgi:ATP-dependent protease ClpP protease subunit